ncbi:MAG: EamA family transporter, partial [bacterium]
MGGGDEGADRDAWRTFGAYAAVYLIWGSTYLAIKLVSQHGAFVMAGSRFLVAGALLLGIAWWQGAVRRSDFSLASWMNAAVVGAC